LQDLVGTARARQTQVQGAARPATLKAAAAGGRNSRDRARPRKGLSFGEGELPLLAMFRPVSAGLLLAKPNSRFKVPEGVAVSLPAGSACH
jgi:hypothetical protein